MRGRDIAPSTATQVALQRLLGVPTPRYRHHLLLLDPTGLRPAPRAEPAGPHPSDSLTLIEPPAAPAASPTATAPAAPASPPPKLAKLHGSLPFTQLRARHAAPELCGLLAYAADLLDRPLACTPAELVSAFDWRRVRARDRVARWDPDRGLVFDEPGS